MSRMHIVIFGAGVVGFATGQAFLEKSVRVTFADVDTEKIARLRQDGFTAMQANGVRLSGVDAILVSVPTPAGPKGQDTSYLDAATVQIGTGLRKIRDDHYPVVVYRSTQLPGQTERLIGILEECSDKKAGIHFGVVHAPEYLRSENPSEFRNPLADSRNPLAILIGHDPEDERSVAVMEKLYRRFNAPMHFLTWQEAELQKVWHNVLNAITISAFNEVRLLAHAIGIPDDRVDQIFAITAVTAESRYNPRYGTRNFGPYDGTCLPKEVEALLEFAGSDNVATAMPLVAATQEVNRKYGGW